MTPNTDWPQVKDFAQRSATALVQAKPRRYTAALAKAKRRERIFIDYLRNKRVATAVMPYSARACDHAPIAVQATWAELGQLDCAAH